ncbi:MAG: DUF1501 domain-containing protein [Inquilinus sp.]|nr:DUF1501 domain-containing protein [Inquilinus sp.]
MAVSRRMVLGGTACATALSVLDSRLALADAVTDRRFVLVILRGGLDGLAAVPPYGDRFYRQIRGGLALDDPMRGTGLADLDGFFGLHPALEPLVPWYRSGQLLPVHAVATPYRERSHFDGQDLLETGADRPGGARDGWLNRAIGLLDGGGRRLGLAVGQTVPLVLRGDTPVASWSPAILPEADDAFLDRLAMLYRDDAVFGPMLAEAVSVDAMAESALAGADRRSSGRRAAEAADLARVAGGMLAAPDGPRIAVLEVSGWDTHARQGTETGQLARSLTGLAGGLTELRAALGPAWRETIVAVVTEFGRTVAPNGTGGTDHGTGAAALLAGGRVAGGQVLADWPGLAPGRLYEGRDLAPTLDLRSVMTALLREHLELPADAVSRVVFPDGPAASLTGLVAA